MHAETPQPQRETAPETSSQTKSASHGHKTALLIALLILLVLLAGYCALCALGGRGLVYPNVTVQTQPLSGLTLSEAEVTYTDFAAAQTPDDTHGLSFTVESASGTSAQVQVPLSSVTTDCTATAAEAWNVGNASPFPARGAIYLQCLLTGREVLPVYSDSTALDAILDEMDAQIGQEAVESTWELGDTQLTLTKGQPGSLLHRESVKEQIFDYLNRGEWVALDGAAPQFTIQLQEALPQALDLEAILTEVERPVQNAVFDKEGKKFQVESEGISFDATAAQAVYDGMAWGETQAVDLIITEPTTTLEDLTPQLYQDLLGTCSSTISGSENRRRNIDLAAQLFTDTVLLPGEEFAYNVIVGSRQASRGFLPAPAYVSGQTVQEVGGGVCQGSSTIYLAALRANLEIVERYPHGYITRYVPEGMDAAVYYGVKDFRFKNNTPFPIKVVGSVKDRVLTVNIMGTKSDNITVEMTNEIVGTTGYKTVYQVSNSLAAGQTSVSVTPYQGYTVKVYRNLYENGALIDTKLENTSVYRSRDKVVLVSPADAYKYGIPGYSAPAPKPAAPDTTETEASGTE